MSQVKLSVSLSESEVAALDKYAHAAGLKSRSAAIQQAIRLLGDAEWSVPEKVEACVYAASSWMCRYPSSYSWGVK